MGRRTPRGDAVTGRDRRGFNFGFAADIFYKFIYNPRVRPAVSAGIAGDKELFIALGLVIVLFVPEPDNALARIIAEIFNPAFGADNRVIAPGVGTVLFLKVLQCFPVMSQAAVKRTPFFG